MPKPRVGVIFGSRSPEHDISIITAQQIIAALDVEKYDVVPIYITKDGKWYTGSRLMRLETFTKATLDFRGLAPVTLDAGRHPSLPPWLSRFLRAAVPVTIDIAFPAVHGPFGEDGTLQGLLEMANVPYVGSGVAGSAVGMDKLLMKAVFQGNGLPILPYLGFTRHQWERSQESVLQEIEALLPYPLFVKPANLGSSIAVAKAKDKSALIEALQLAALYDRRLVVEKGLDDPIEINCAVMGDEELTVSPCEQPVRRHDFLSFEDKYVHGGKAKGMKGTDRLIPAPIDTALTMRIQELAKKTFQACDCRGVARIDFLIDGRSEEVFVNEINTIPGSLSFYLWEQMGIDFTRLCDMLVAEALKSFRDKERTIHSLPISLLSPSRESSRIENPA